MLLTHSTTCTTVVDYLVKSYCRNKYDNKFMQIIISNRFTLNMRFQLKSVASYIHVSSDAMAISKRSAHTGSHRRAVSGSTRGGGRVGEACSEAEWTPAATCRCLHYTCVTSQQLLLSLPSERTPLCTTGFMGYM